MKDTTSSKGTVSLLKKFAIPLLLAIVALLTYKFIMWNLWKVDQSVKMVGKIQRARGAVNLKLMNENKVLLKKSFAFNPRGNYYIVYPFEVTPYIVGKNKEYRLILTLSVNGKGEKGLPVQRFSYGNIIKWNGYYFVFPIRGASIEEFLHMQEHVGQMIAAIKQNEPAVTPPANRR
jgi:hypothetical protein